MARIKRLPDGTFFLEVAPYEIEAVMEKIIRQEDLTDQEIEIAREFRLI